MITIREKVLIGHGRSNIRHAVEVLIGHGGSDIKYVNKSLNKLRRTGCLEMV